MLEVLIFIALLGILVMTLRLTSAILKKVTGSVTNPGSGSGGGGGGAWTPADTTTDLWLDAADASTITDDGNGRVTAWADKSGNGYVLDQSDTQRRPETSARTQNGLNVIDFQKTLTGFGLKNNQYLVDSGAYSAAYSGIAKDHTVVFLFKLDVLNSSNYVYGYGAGSSNVSTQLLFRATTDHYVYNGRDDGGSTDQALGLNGADTDFALVALTFDGSQVKIFKNGVQLAVDGLPVGVCTYERFRVGNDARGLAPSTTGMEGAFCEQVIVHSALSTEDRQKFEGYLAHKWGTTASLPVDHPYKTTAP